jgi:hypothetical protein
MMLQHLKMMFHRSKMTMIHLKTKVTPCNTRASPNPSEGGAYERIEGGVSLKEHRPGF